MNSSLVLCLLVAVLSGNQASGHRLVVNSDQQPDVSGLEYGNDIDLEDFFNELEASDIEAFLEGIGFSENDIDLADLEGFSCTGALCCFQIGIKGFTFKACVLRKPQSLVFTLQVGSYKFQREVQVTSGTIPIEINKTVLKVIKLQNIVISEINLATFSFCVQLRVKVMGVQFSPKYCKKSDMQELIYLAPYY